MTVPSFPSCRTESTTVPLVKLIMYTHRLVCGGGIEAEQTEKGITRDKVKKKTIKKLKAGITARLDAMATERVERGRNTCCVLSGFCRINLVRT